MRSRIREYQEHDSWKPYRAAVSLHAHTHHSREIMADLPRYIARIPGNGHPGSQPTDRRMDMDQNGEISQSDFHVWQSLFITWKQGRK